MAVPVVKYSLEITTSAQKELDSLDDPLFARIDRKILALADDPRPVGSKKLKGYKDLWRISSVIVRAPENGWLAPRRSRFA